MTMKKAMKTAMKQPKAMKASFTTSSDLTKTAGLVVVNHGGGFMIFIAKAKPCQAAEFRAQFGRWVADLGAGRMTTICADVNVKTLAAIPAGAGSRLITDQEAEEWARKL